MSALLMLALLNTTAIEEINASEENAPTWAVQLRLTTPSTVVSSAGLGGLAYVSTYLSLGTGAVFERALNRKWSLSLGTDLAASHTSSAFEQSGFALSLAPGFRWYGDRVFEGGFVGVQVPLSYGISSWYGSPTLQTRSLIAGVDLLLGWSFHFNNRFLLSIAAAPELSLAHNTSPAIFGTDGVVTSVTTNTVQFGVRGQLGLGVNF